MRTQRTRRMSLALVVVALLASACAARAPAGMDLGTTRIWQANEALVALGTVLDAAVALNTIERCDAVAGSSAICTPLLSTANTRVVVQTVRAAAVTLDAVEGANWRPVSLTALKEIRSGLDAAGQEKIGAYVEVAELIVNRIR